MNIQDINNKTQNALMLGGFNNIRRWQAYLINYSDMKNIYFIRHLNNNDNMLVAYFTAYKDYKYGFYKADIFNESIRFSLSPDASYLEIRYCCETQQIFMSDMPDCIILYNKLLELIQAGKSYTDILDFVKAVNILS